MSSLTPTLIRTFTSTLTHSQRRLHFHPFFQISNLHKLSAKQLFNQKEPPVQQKASFFGKDEKIDHLTNDELKEYEQKLKLIRVEYEEVERKVYQKYDGIRKEMEKQFAVKIRHQQQQQAKSSTPQPQEQDDEFTNTLAQEYQLALQDLQAKRLSELFTLQQSKQSRITKLTSEYRTNFSKARKQYQTQYIKKYMLENIKELKEEPSQMEKMMEEIRDAGRKEQGYIPNELVVKKLFFRTTDGKERQVLLAGVEQNDEDHCAYLKTLIQKLRIKHVLTMMPPDLPFFIKTQTSFLIEWMQFLRRPTPHTKFYLNPSAKTLNDITLQRAYIPHVLHGLTRSKSFYQTTFSLMQLNEVNFKYQHQALYAGLVASTTESVYFCDYPFLREREMMALNMGLDELRQLIKQHAYFKQQKRENFSAELLLPKAVVEKKFRHIIKLAKTIALTTQSSPMLICPASIAQVLSQQWKHSPPSFLQFDPSQNTFLLDMQLTKLPDHQSLFIQFIEKLVILDIILSPLIQNYFVKYNSFPFSCRNTIGGKENLGKVFLLWKHYYTLYDNAVKGKVDTRREHGEMPQ